jgi:hypothetical protein
VVKQIVGGPDAPDRYEREVTALRLAASAGVAPRLLGTDPGSRALVLEYLDDDGPPGDWVVPYAEGLARLHASAGPDGAVTLPTWQGPGAADVRAFLSLVGHDDRTRAARPPPRRRRPADRHAPRPRRPAPPERDDA